MHIFTFTWFVSLLVLSVASHVMNRTIKHNCIMKHSALLHGFDYSAIDIIMTISTDKSMKKIHCDDTCCDEDECVAIVIYDEDASSWQNSNITCKLLKTYRRTDQETKRFDTTKIDIIERSVQNTESSSESSERSRSSPPSFMSHTASSTNATAATTTTESSTLKLPIQPVIPITDGQPQIPPNGQPQIPPNDQPQIPSSNTRSNTNDSSSRPTSGENTRKRNHHHDETDEALTPALTATIVILVIILLIGSCVAVVLGTILLKRRKRAKLLAKTQEKSKTISITESLSSHTAKSSANRSSRVSNRLSLRSERSKIGKKTVKLAKGTKAKLTAKTKLDMNETATNDCSKTTTVLDSVTMTNKRNWSEIEDQTEQSGMSETVRTLERSKTAMLQRPKRESLTTTSTDQATKMKNKRNKSKYIMAGQLVKKPQKSKSSKHITNMKSVNKETPRLKRNVGMDPQMRKGKR